MAKPQLLASCWTHAGDAAPQRGDERSPFSLSDRIAAVGAAGWAGIGLLHADLIPARDTLGYDTVARKIADAGLAFVELEFLGDWWTTGEERAASDLVRRDLFEAAEALGAQTIKVAGKMFATEAEADVDAMAEAFDALSTEAASHSARIALEALPFSNFSTVGKGSAFVSDVGNPNGGLIVDIWHVYRGGTVPSDLLTQVDPNHLFAVELNDAAEPAPDFDGLWLDTISSRRLPGDGDWDVPGFINVMRQLGFDGPWGVEILSDEHRAKSLAEEVAQALAATNAAFTAADAAR